MGLVILACVFSTVLMTGIVWFVQIIHYPLMHEVGTAEFKQYEQMHTRLAGRLIAPVMLLEMITTMMILFNDFNTSTAITVTLLAVIWFSTFLIQVPLHRKLSESFNREQLTKLINTNWVRTIAWTLKSVVMLTMIGEI